MQNAGEVPQNRQQDIQPELTADTDLQEHTSGGSRMAMMMRMMSMIKGSSYMFLLPHPVLI